MESKSGSALALTPLVLLRDEVRERRARTLRAGLEWVGGLIETMSSRYTTTRAGTGAGGVDSRTLRLVATAPGVEAATSGLVVGGAFLLPTAGLLAPSLKWVRGDTFRDDRLRLVASVTGACTFFDAP